MSGYLVDTDVISAGAPARGEDSSSLLLWMDQNSRSLFISTITVAEIADGIAKARREGARRKAARLTGWLEALLHLYGDRVLPFDVAAARIAGALSDRARSNGRIPGFPDLAIAATAAAHGLTVLTSNLRHFEPLNVAAHNPRESLPVN
jgi:predicted nucleic acid-binding protein